MEARILPPSEWTRLDGTDIAKAIPYHHAEDITVVVVEDDGEIVATWAVLRVVQMEGVWIRPDHRKRGRAAVKLLDKTFEVAQSLAPYMAFTGSQSEEVSHLLTKHLGALKLEQETFVIPLSEHVPCR